MVLFEEEQKLHQPWLWMILAVPVAVVAFGVHRQLVLHKPWGNHPLPDTGLIAVALALLLFLAWLYSVRLVTEVHEREVVIHYVLLWRRKRIPIEAIRRAEAVTYSPIWDYGGWGIRMGSNGWAYTASGNRGVQLEFHYGSNLLVGSQRAEELAQIIGDRMRVAGAGA